MNAVVLDVLEHALAGSLTICTGPHPAAFAGPSACNAVLAAFATWKHACVDWNVPSIPYMCLDDSQTTVLSLPLSLIRLISRFLRNPGKRQICQCSKLTATFSGRCFHHHGDRVWQPSL